MADKANKTKWAGVFECYPKADEIYVVNNQPFISEELANNQTRFTNFKVEVVTRADVDKAVKAEAAAVAKAEKAAAAKAKKEADEKAKAEKAAAAK